MTLEKIVVQNIILGSVFICSLYGIYRNLKDLNNYNEKEKLNEKYKK